MSGVAFTYAYARPALTVDCVVFGFDGTGLAVLLIRRGKPPFEGRWALPGGFVRLDETLEEAAERELAEETGLKGVYLEQLCTFGEVDRDPRERVVTVAYFALVKPGDPVTRASTDAAEARWFPVDRLPRLAFDHGGILAAARERLCGKVRYTPVGFELLPEKFTLSELQRLYEAVLGVALDKRNFRKKVLDLDLLEPLDEMRRGGRHRPAQLFRFDRVKYERLTKRGIHFEL